MNLLWTDLASIAAITVTICSAFFWATKLIVKEEISIMKSDLSLRFLERERADEKLSPLSNSMARFESHLDKLALNLETKIDRVEQYTHTNKHNLANEIQVIKFRMDEFERHKVISDKRLDNFELVLNSRFKSLDDSHHATHLLLSGLQRDILELKNHD